MSKQLEPEHRGPVLVSEVESLKDASEPPPIADINKNEPIVTRKELWSYYCTFKTFEGRVRRLKD